MFVLYLLAGGRAPERFRFATMYSNESVWIVPGTMNEND
jgi:hypothetical protein